MTGVKSIDANVITTMREPKKSFGSKYIPQPSKSSPVSKPNPCCVHVNIKSAPPRVALLIETARSFGRDFLRGISKYSELHGPWDFLLRAGDFQQDIPKIKRWGGTGIIARISSDEMARQVIDCNLPTITLGLTEEQRGHGNSLAQLVNVGSKPEQIAQIAVDFFRKRAFSNFAYVGDDERAWSTARETEFVRLLRKSGLIPHIYVQPKSLRLRRWEYEQPLMAKWIGELPKPIGILACNDDRGREILDACILAEVRVPEDVAVLGVDNDSVFCDLSQPPLSSIILNAEGAGFQAAERLEAMMNGQSSSCHQLDVEVIGTAARRSTEAIAVEDPVLSQALSFIHENRGEPITIEDVIEHVGVSRRGLESRFRKTLKRSILNEIHNVRLDESKRLLRESTMSITHVALSAGFTTTTYFSEFFRKRVGITPRQYRRKFS
jgi:LacI family transcriptional regulator